jgi:hypothetical protein
MMNFRAYDFKEEMLRDRYTSGQKKLQEEVVLKEARVFTFLGPSPRMRFLILGQSKFLVDFVEIIYGELLEAHRLLVETLKKEMDWLRGEEPHSRNYSQATSSNF